MEKMALGADGELDGAASHAGGPRFESVRRPPYLFE